MRLRVGARGSDLSLSQTGWLIERLKAAHPELQVDLIVIETHGDRDQNSALDRLWPPGGFVREIERALLESRIDMAVHSLKDLPTEPVPGLVIASVPVREDPGDCLLLRQPLTLDDLPAGFIIGSSSPRRSHQILRRNPHVRTEPIRGNVPTRIRKLMEGVYDGIILAAAGLSRLKITHEHITPLPVQEFLPAPGQGALAAQTRENDWAREIAHAIEHPPTRAAITAERAFLRGCGGGCHAALGALGSILPTGELHLKGHLFVDGKLLEGQIQGPASAAESLGIALAHRLHPRP
jgi:hydroxymethylbilane synthase